VCVCGVADGGQTGTRSSQAEARVGHGSGQNQHAYHSAQHQRNQQISCRPSSFIQHVTVSSVSSVIAVVDELTDACLS